MAKLAGDSKVTRVASAARVCRPICRQASTDHELTSGADALEKLRAGFTVEIRGSHDYLLPEVVAAINTLPVIPASLTICTDDVFPIT